MEQKDCVQIKKSEICLSILKFFILTNNRYKTNIIIKE